MANENSISRSIAIYSAVKLLTENAKTFTSGRPSEKDVVRIAGIFLDFIDSK